METNGSQNGSVAQPDVKIKEGSSLEDMKISVRVIEGMFHAVDAASFPLKFHGHVMNGMTFLRAVHASLIKELGPEEIAKIRQGEAFQAAAGASPAGKAN